jgi:hypothetical protein
MKYKLELDHPELSRARLIVSDQQIVDIDADKTWTAVIDVHGPTKIELWFWPWKIKPLLRLNGHLLDYGLANVVQYDHMLCFNVGKDYFTQYGQALVNSRIHSQFKGGPIDENIYDAVVGYGHRHSDLIAEIKKRIE